MAGRPRPAANQTYTRQPTCPRWLTAEKSHARETARHVHAPAHLPAQALRPSVAVAFVSAPRSQHSCFAALAKNSHLRTVFTALRAAASRRSIPTVTSFPRNDKLLGRVRRLITFIRFKPKRTPVPPCHCEERNARRGNLPEGKTYLRTRPPQILARGGSPPRNPPQ